MKKTKRLIAPILGAGLVFGVTFASASEKVTVEPEDGQNWELTEGNVDRMVEETTMDITTDSSESESSIVTHVVQPGNTLLEIAAVYDGVTVDDLYRLNPTIDPYLLTIGSEIVVVDYEQELGEDYLYHTVQPGNTFNEIAGVYDGVTVEEIKEANPNVDPYSLTIGSKIVIPLN